MGLKNAQENVHDAHFSVHGIVMQTLNHHARKIFSFDKKLQKSFPDYVVEKLGINDL
jgi:hypothetical protein